MGACHSSSDHHPRHKHPPSDGRPNLNSLDNHTSTKVSSHSSMPESNIDKISPYTKYDDINKYYTLGSHRGSGSFGIVREAVEQTTNQKFAVKTVWKAQFVDKKKFIQQEIEILMQVEHDNIIKCYQVYEDMNSIHFVFDLIEGGELFDYLINSPGRVIPESRAVDLFNQILDSLQYLHDKNIVHRDIKPENFLIYHSGNKIKLKLIDFGFATVVKEGEKLTDKVGSLQYIAPEMLSDNDYDSKIDMWASGVVLYNMLTGKQPFFGKGDSELINNILNSQVVFSEIFFKNQNAKNICQNLLQKDPIKRFSANDAKASMWIQNFINIDILPTIQGAKFAPKEENIKNILNLLNQQSNIKAEIWNMMLTYFTLDNMIQLRTKLYEVRDQNCLVGEAVEGTIGGKDFCPFQVFLQTILDNITIVPEFYDKISDILNTKQEVCQKQVVNFKDLMDKLIKCKTMINRERAWNAFNNQDKKSQGCITLDQLQDCIRTSYPKYDPEKLKEIIKMSALTDSDHIKFDDFYKVWEKIATFNKSGQAYLI